MRILRFVLVSVLTCVVLMAQTAIASSQTLPFLNGQSTVTVPPPDVTRYGGLEVTWVRSPVDDERLFQIASPTVLDRSEPSNPTLPVEVRARNIEAQLWIEVTRFRGNVIQQFMSQIRETAAPESRLTSRSAAVIISTLNNRPVLQIKSSEGSRPLTVATVTQTDVDFYSETPNLLAEEWQRILQQEVNQIERLASPERMRLSLRQTVIIVVGAVLGSGLFGGMHWLLGRQRRTLEKRHDRAISQSFQAQPEPASEQASTLDTTVSNTTSEEAEPAVYSGLLGDRRRMLNALRPQPSVERQLTLIRSGQWLLFWLITVGWYGSLVALTHTVPILMQWKMTLLRQPFRLVLVWFGVSLALRLNRLLARRLAQTWDDKPSVLFGDVQRQALRKTTINSVVEWLIACVLVITGILLSLSILGVSTRSILAWGAVLGLAISFGTQSLIKDVVNGCLILLEDQFAVGDVIVVNDKVGFVEVMTLRITRLRDPEGQLITIPNSAIADVRNLTRLWSRVDFTIEVAYENDPDQVLWLLNDVAQSLYHAPDWHEKIPAPPEVMGIDRLSHTGMLVRVWIQTAPLQQWAVGREYRLRVRRAFETHGILIGKPQWISYHAPLDAAALNGAMNQ